jgi:transcriptional regulator
LPKNQRCVTKSGGTISVGMKECRAKRARGLGDDNSGGRCRSEPRANEHWKALGSKAASLAVFQGPQTYISPSWYETKQHGKVVPTWNYVVVHAHGPLEIVEDRDWLLAHLEDLVTANESRREQPWAISDAPTDFIDGMTRAIVGLRLTVDRLEGKWKMIQNRSEADRSGTLFGLSASADARDQAVAAIMRALERARRLARNMRQSAEVGKPATPFDLGVLSKSIKRWRP